MQDLIEKLAQAREIEAEYKAQYAALKAEIDAVIEERYGLRLGSLEAFLETAEADVTDAENRIRAAALDAFAETGDKHPHPAVGIQMTRLEYDTAEAIQFCRRAAPNAIKLDKRAFERIARVGKDAGGPFDLDFVTIHKEPQATIARDLSAYAGDKDEG